jgi:hypothetical protein
MDPVLQHERSVAAVRSKLIVMTLLLCVAVAGLTGAEELRIRSSQGTSEIFLPGSGWRQAVSGRRFPPGGRLATWVDARVSFGFGERAAGDGGGEEDTGRTSLTVEIGPLGQLEFRPSEESRDGDALSFRLHAGTVDVRATGMQIAILTRYATLELNSAEVRYSNGVLRVVDGAVLVRYPRGGIRSVEAPATVDLAKPSAEPVFRTSGG